MQVQFDTHNNDKQKQVCKHWIDDSVTDIVYGGSKGSGKSYLGCSLIFGDALTYAGTHYFIARKKLDDLRKFTIPSVYEVFKHWGIHKGYYTYNGQDSFFELYNGSRVYLLTAKYLPSDPEYYRFGSMQMTRGWIEEAGEFELDAKNNLNASVGRWKNDVYKLPPKLLQTCNPSKNYLYREYFKKNREKTLEPWKRFVQALPQDNKMLPGGYLENLERTLTRNQKERLLFGNWDYDDDPALLIESFDKIVDCFTNDYVKGDGRKYISADLAMQGRDKFVAGVWDGLVCDLTKGLVRDKSTGKSIEVDLKDLMVRYSVPRSNVVADSDGLGNYLESYLVGINEFHGGATAFDKKEYANLKAECAYKLADVINKGELKIICTPEQQEEIEEELGVLKAMDVDKDETRKKIIDKKHMKELLGRSPDYLDMLLMRMYFTLKRQGVKAFAR